MFSWGANSYGQLGQGFCSEQCLKPVKINEKDISVNPASVIQIDGGAGHTLILDHYGKIWACGWNNLYQLGINNSTFIFKQIIGYENIKFVQIACGWDFSAAVSSNKELYVWGSNNFGQLGLFKEPVKFITKPVKVDGLIAKYVACGLRHTVIITSDNKIKVCGSNVNGQLGLVNVKRSINKFQEVSNVEDVKMVACGQKHTIVLTNKYEFYAWGDNKWGQLGFDSSTFAASKTPIKLNFSCIDKPIQLHCGWTHNVVLTTSGELWTWGRNSYGQLGHNSTNGWQPKKLKLTNVTDVAIGAEHNLVISENKIYSWGWNEHGNCGNNSQKDIFEPLVIFSNKLNQKIFCIGCGTGQSMAAIK